MSRPNIWKTILFFGLVFAMLLSACGGQPTPVPEEPVATEAPTETEAPAAAEEPVAAGPCGTSPAGKATVWMMGFDPHVNGWTNVAEGYMKYNPNAEIVVEPQGGQADMLAKYKASLASGSGGDLFTVPGWDVYEWAVTKQIAPLSPNVMTYEDAKAKLFPEYILQAPIDDQLWAVGIPDPPGDAGLIVNAGALEEAGLELIPQFANREQMLEYAQALTKRDGDNINTGGLSFREDNAGTYFLSYIADQGGVFWDNEKQEFNFNTPEAKAAAEFILGLYETEKVDSVLLPAALEGLLQGTVSMAYMWPEFMPFASSAAPDFKFNFIMKPAFSGDSPAVFSHADTWNAVIPGYAEDNAVAWDLMCYLASEEGQLLFLDANPGLSPLRSLVFENEYYTTGKGAYLLPLIEAMKAGRFRYWGPFLDGSTIQYDILWANLDAMLNGEQTVDETLQKLTEQANAQTQQSRQRLPEAPDINMYFEGLPEDMQIK